MGVTFPLAQSPPAVSPPGDDAGASPTKRAASSGFGLLLPFRRDEKNDFAHGSGARLIAANIRQILTTVSEEEDAAGEVAWDGTLGSRLQLLTHRNGTPGLDEIARHFVVDAIRAQEPRARITTVKVQRRKNTSFIMVKFIPTDRNGRPIGQEETVDIPLPE